MCCNCPNAPLNWNSIKRITWIFRVTHIQWTPYSIRARAFFESYHTLWGIITPNKLILVKMRLQKLDSSFTLKTVRKTSKNACVLIHHPVIPTSVPKPLQNSNLEAKYWKSLLLLLLGNQVLKISISKKLSNLMWHYGFDNCNHFYMQAMSVLLKPKIQT